MGAIYQNEICYSGGGGASTLEGLNDVDVSHLGNNEILKYDEVNSKWVNGAVMAVTQVKLNKNSWSNKSQTVTAYGVTGYNNVLVTPAPSSYEEYSVCMVRATQQSMDSLKFECDKVPTNNLYVNLAFWG